MDLKSESPYFLIKNGLLHSYPSLQENKQADIVIMGAGITGALVAWHLVQAGFAVTIVDRRHAAMGSTCASTSLLQYEIDTPMHQLAKMVGDSNATRSYELCRQAIDDIGQICQQLAADTGFKPCKSLQFASRRSHVKKLKAEYHYRKERGFDVDWLEASEVKDKFKLEVPAGLYSMDGATVDAYALAHQLLYQSSKKGLTIYDNTNIEHIRYQKQQIELKTSTGYTLTCKELIIACGYESQQYLPKKVEHIQSTYAIVSEAVPGHECWYENAMIWETAVPYLYMRTTPENRILIGGLDDDFYNPERRDKKVRSKALQLEKKFKRMRPDILFRTDFSWAGSFATTKDGLPYIGSVSKLPHTWFALGFGGNGITFSEIAARLLTDKLSGKTNKDLPIFSFDR